MTDYKDTLNLPQTLFPMKANLAAREPELLARWQAMDIYKRMRQHTKGRPKFILHDGPPYANGRIHIGHAVNKVLKDIITKSKTLDGYDAPFVPGWDCHGLPIELNVEKKIGKAGSNVSPKEFRRQCRQYADEQYKLQRDDFIRLGVLGDWSHPYLTMDYQFEADIIRTLGRIIKNGHVHRGYKPVHWCTDCGSALAEAEVEYEDKTSPAIDVRFRVLDEEAFWQRAHHVIDTHIQGALSVIIWTTTPWTLPSNQAVALNPHLEYVIVECCNDVGTKEYLFLAESLLKDAMVRFGIQNYHVKAYCKGEAVEGILLQHPFYDRQVPIVLGDHVTTDVGTGAVHTAPGHGLDDYFIGIKYGLPVDHEVNDHGCFNDDTPLFAKQPIFKANNEVIEVLKAHGNLVHAEMLKHSYPHCWRHKTPLIFRGTPQWFISMEQNGLRSQVLENIRKTKWIPDWGMMRMEDMIMKRPDWCISRQRSWGVPIPLFLHNKTNHLHPETPRLLEEVAKQVEQGGADIWFDLTPEELLGEEAKDYHKLNDILDVWFDSGASYACVLEKNPDLHFPADIYFEGSDQHRGWFQTSLLSSTATQGIAPFKRVITHGFTVDSQGRKMSKSLGNVVAPEKVVKQLGADVLRLWVAATDYRSELSLSDEILKRNSDLYRRIRNTARYLLANINEFIPEQHSVKSEEMLALDRFIVDKARTLQQEIIQCYNDYQFHVICQKIHHFCSIELGSFYLDVTKDRQYTNPKNSLARRSSQTAMHHILEALVRWLSPILSFTAEEIWQYLPGKREESVFMANWYEGFSSIFTTDRMNQDFWYRLMAVRDQVNKEIEYQRNKGHIGSALEAEVEIFCAKELYEDLLLLGDELRFVLITSSATAILANEPPENAVATEIKQLWLRVTPTQKSKCVRCWHYCDDVGKNTSYIDICGRCIENIEGSGETRLYA